MESITDYTNTSDSVSKYEKEPRVGEKSLVTTVIFTCIIVNSVCLIAASCVAVSWKKDGGWSVWESWSECSTTSGGLRSRTRTCTNPVPSLLGEFCRGNQEEFELCNFVGCSDQIPDIEPAERNGKIEEMKADLEKKDSQINDLNATVNKITSQLGSIQKDVSDMTQAVAKLNKVCLADKKDGRWSSWGSWSECSVTCSIGTRTRLRNCANPRPTLTGRYCDGLSSEVDICRTQTCADRKVAFTAYGIAGSAYGINAVRFPTILENHGAAYDSATGTFRCVTPGLYHFVATLSVIHKPHGDGLLCNIYVNNLEKISLYVYKTQSSEETYPATASGTFHLKKNDVVYIGYCSSYLSEIYNDEGTSFTGILVTPDM